MKAIRDEDYHRRRKALPLLSAVAAMALFTVGIIQTVWAWIETGGRLCDGSYDVISWITTLLTMLVGLGLAVQVFLLNKKRET